MIRIGPAGWSYRDWEGIVYPRQTRFDQLRYLSQFFTTIEVNSTFYGAPRAKTTESWIQHTDHSADFRFTLKLGQNFTHQRERLDSGEVRQWKEGAAPLVVAGKLGAVLVQFPWSFKNNQESRRYLVELVGRFSELPLVVEFRHGSWGQPAVLEFLSDLRVAICSIDQPLIGNSLPAHCHVTSPIGYFRCHGRNYRDWFREDAGRDNRYNYLYSEEELDQQSDLVRGIREQAEEVYVIYNNHYRGQAVLNALQLRQRIEGSITGIPEPLLNTYPQATQLLAKAT
ncbi:DUF72 domain-containing protein [Acidobacteria bacterium AH-259-D05]|nr:DUF72 domain-containing protein [Acidobacteria bacterium AH-259-D05]